MIFVIIWSGFAQNVYGLPIESDPLKGKENPYIRIPLLIFMFFIGVWVEHDYFNAKVIQEYGAGYISRRYYKVFLRVNLVTFPLTQILAYVFYLYFWLFFWIYILLIEIGVVYIESYLLKIELKGVVDLRVPPKIILKRVFVANLISFLLGLLVALPSFLELIDSIIYVFSSLLAL